MTELSPFERGERDGLSGKPGPAFPKADSPWEDRLYARGWSRGIDRRERMLAEADVIEGLLARARAK